MEIIIPIAVVVVIVAFFIYASKGGAKLLAEREARMAKAEKGKAVVIEMCIRDRYIFAAERSSGISLKISIRKSSRRNRDIRVYRQLDSVSAYDSLLKKP